MISIIKALLKKSPVPLSLNHRYDLQTKNIIRTQCDRFSNCIDIGAHRGHILGWMKRFAPEGRHFAFEPIPHLCQHLKKKYSGSNCTVSGTALADTKGAAPFNYVISNPAYSGLKKRSYDRKHEKDMVITVETDLLDNKIPPAIPIRLIKIDVEGAEMGVLKGAARILSEYHPLVIFEFGMGASDLYGTTPEMMYSFFDSFNYRIALLGNFIKGGPPLAPEEFRRQFHERINYYFIAYPKAEHTEF